ncbi:MAG: hypothetical protein HYS07_01690 [Chlamydiae bacterium]|nr:hypothetical protein [Chlamydiota bacterium]
MSQKKEGVLSFEEVMKDFYHVACMKNNGIQWMVSNDSVFDRFQGIRRMNPLKS